MVCDSKKGLYAKIFSKTKNSISLDFRFVDLKNTGGHATLNIHSILTARSWLLDGLGSFLSSCLMQSARSIIHNHCFDLQLICSQGNHSVLKTNKTSARYFPSSSW